MIFAPNDTFANSIFCRPFDIDDEYNQWAAPVLKLLKYSQIHQQLCHVGGLVKQIRNSTYGSIDIMNAIAYGRDLYKRAVNTIRKKNMSVYAFLGTLSKPQLVMSYNRTHGRCAL
jgi:hypothetical protein